MPEKLIIGLGHKKRVGKDTAARFFVNHLRLTKKGLNIQCRSFATKLKWVCYDLYSWAGLKEPEFYDRSENFHLREVILPRIGKSPRTIWIEFGTYVGRAVYDNTWIDYLYESELADIIIIPDLRFPNEATNTLDRGGYLIKIENPNVLITNDIADCALDGFNNWHKILINDGSLKDLNYKVIAICKELGI